MSCSHLDNMGRLSDTFRAQFEEMKARHAETDRQIEASIKKMQAAIKEIDRIDREIEAL